MVDNSLFIPFFLIKIITQMLNQFKGTFTIFKNILLNWQKLFQISFVIFIYHHNLSSWMYLKYEWNVIIFHVAKREGVKNLYFSKKKIIHRDNRLLNIYIITICLKQIFAKWILFFANHFFSSLLKTIVGRLKVITIHPLNIFILCELVQS